MDEGVHPFPPPPTSSKGSLPSALPSIYAVNLSATGCRLGGLDSSAHGFGPILDAPPPKWSPKLRGPGLGHLGPIGQGRKHFPAAGPRGPVSLGLTTRL